MKLWTLYCHTHIESGRRYIGLTSRTMERRWAQHCIQSRSSKDGRWHFPNAVRKYGSEAFEHEVLACSWNLEGANATEEELILQYDTRNPEKGFNLAKGGGSKSHPLRKNPWDDLEFRKRNLPKLVAAGRTVHAVANMMASHRTDGYRNKMSLISKETHSRPEVKAKLSASSKGRVFSLDHREKLVAANVARRIYYERQREIRLGQNIIKQCKKHGSLSRNECSIGVRPAGGLRIECKQCLSERSRKIRRLSRM